MLSTRLERIRKTAIPMPTSWLIGECMEARGKQELFTRQTPEVLEALRQQAIIQSVESSNRIEGVTVAADRLKPIVIGNSRPRDRSEEELVGYRKALDWIFSHKTPVKIEPRLVRHLHELAQGGSGDAGQWKTRSNEIIEVLPSGARRVRFVPTSPKDTPRMVEQLCLSYSELIQQSDIPALLSIATCVFDFLCIHPFRDGNGRVSRLLTTLLLQNHEFRVGRFVSLERRVEESKQDYYDVLARCSKGWHEGKNEIIPWWNYSLGVLRRAYGEFERRVENAAPDGKSELVRQTILRQFGPFTLAEIKSECPAASPQLIKKVLAKMKSAGTVRLAGRGRGAKWEVLR
jgi:Fic family protein